MTYKYAHPDLLLFKGNVWTQDSATPKVEAIAIAEGRILEIGDNDTIRRLARSDTKKINLNGRLVLPGFIDTHFHYYDWALGRLDLDLAGLASLDELTQVVQSAARQKKPGEWILGHGFNESDWPVKRMPTRDDLDAVAPDNPVLLSRCDLHLAVANTIALKKADINSSTPEPPKGVIAKDSLGRPNGILKEHAVHLVKVIIPRQEQKDIQAAMRDGIPVLHSMGITGIHDIRMLGSLEGATAFNCWQHLNDQGDLDLRCWVTISGECLEEAIVLGIQTGFGNDTLRIGHVKYFADGGMGARTAWMLEPYLDAESGMSLIQMKDLRQAALKADQAGLAVAIHCVGDRTNREIITLFENLEKSRNKSGNITSPSVPHRIEHVQMIRPEDASRLAHLNIVACVQPHNLILDMGMIDECLGPMGKYTYAFRTILDAGIPTCLSSDAPVCDPRPLANIHAAVTRRRPDGTPVGGWYPDQRISVDEAVRGYTLTPAIASGVDNQLGSISVGKRADLVIVDRNIFTIDPMDIISTRVDMTIFNGRIVYQRHVL
jgi:predicted amidohydrolase YtcJ